MLPSEIFAPTFVRNWCYTLFVLIPICAAYALYSIAMNWNADWIRHRQPYAYFLWLFIMALADISYTVLLYETVGESPKWFDSLFWAYLVTNVAIFLSLTLYFHRIWMCIYKSLLQKSLGLLDMWDPQAIHELRSSTDLSHFWVRCRHTLGNPNVMSVAWFIIWLLVSSLLLWYAQRGYMYPQSHFANWEIVTLVFSSWIVGFTLVMLVLQWCFTVSDNFNIRTELTMKSLIVACVPIFTETVWHTNWPVKNQIDKTIILLLVLTGELFLQILIMDFHLYMSSRSCGKSSGYDINIRRVLKDEELFRKFEEHQQREFNLQNLNFLVSCIHYRRAAMRQGQFGIGSISNSKNESEMLYWRELAAEEDLDPNKIARFIYGEFCVQGAPQEIKLHDETSKNLSARVRNLSNICNYAEPDLFDEAFDLIHNHLDEESMLRFKRDLMCPPGIHFHKDISQSLGIPLLGSRNSP